MVNADFNSNTDESHRRAGHNIAVRLLRYIKILILSIHQHDTAWYSDTCDLPDLFKSSIVFNGQEKNIAQLKTNRYVV